MAIEFDAATAAYTGSDVSTYTIAHTCSSNANFLLVSVTSHGSVISGVTYNGTAMTLLNSIQNSVSNGRSYLWYLVSPATGTSYNCIASFDSAPTSNPRMTVMSLAGVDTSTPIDVSGTVEGLGTTVTKSVTTTVANGLLVDGLHCMTAPTVDGAQTQRSRHGESVSFGWNGVSTKATTTTGSYSMTWTQGNDRYEYVVAHLKAGALSFITIDTVTMSEQTVSGIIGKVFSILETTTVSETVSAVKSGVFTILDSFSLSDAVSMLRSWPRQTKHTATLTNQSKNSAVTTGQTKHTATLTNQTKHTSELL